MTRTSSPKLLDSAMILAAGLGARMRPLTLRTPKPLVPFCGQALIDHVLDRLRASGIGRAVVNTHYLGEQLAAHLTQHKDLELLLSPEESLLETGGGVKKALPLLAREGFFVTNSDGLWAEAMGAAPLLSRLAESWDPAQMDALLAVVPLAGARGYHGAGDFTLDAAGRLQRLATSAAGQAPLVFIGVQILAARLFAGSPAGAFSLNRLYDKAAQAGRLFGLAHEGDWLHLGTPQDLQAAEALAATGQLPGFASVSSAIANNT